MEFERKHNKTFGRPTEPSIEVLSQRLSDTSLGEEEPTIGQLLDPKNSELYKSLFKSEAYVEIKESKTTGNLNKQYEDISTRNQNHMKQTLKEELTRKEEHTLQKYEVKQNEGDARNKDLTMETKELKEKLKRKEKDTQTNNDKKDEKDKRNQDLTRIINNLEDDLKGELEDIQMYKDKHAENETRNQEKNREILELREQLNQTDKELQRYKDKQDENDKRHHELTKEIKELKHELTRKDEEIYKAQNEMDKRNQENNREILELREQLNQTEKELQRYKDKQDENDKRWNISEVYRENIRLKQNLEDTVKKQEDLSTRNQELTKDTKELKKEVEQKEKTIQENRVKQDGYNNRTKELDTCLRDLTQQLARALSELDTIKEEKDSLLTRLSQYASAKLAHDNPDIADLSDLNRPTKLAERFSELYDNEWTDAFEVLTETYKLNERDSMGRLLNIINEAYKFCLESARKQDDMLKMALFCPGAESADDLPQSLDALQLQSVYDLRRKTSKTSLACIQQHFMQKLRGSGSSSEIITGIHPYVNQCVELCWYMTLPSPAIYIDTTVSKGDIFDKEKYRFFSNIWDKIQFYGLASAVPT